MSTGEMRNHFLTTNFFFTLSAVADEINEEDVAVGELLLLGNIFSSTHSVETALPMHI